MVSVCVDINHWSAFSLLTDRCWSLVYVHIDKFNNVATHRSTHLVIVFRQVSGAGNLKWILSLFWVGEFRHGFWVGVFRHGFWVGEFRHGFWVGVFRHGFLVRGVLSWVFGYGSSSLVLVRGVPHWFWLGEFLMGFG